MKNILITCSIIFLLIGNVLFSNIHYLNEHIHDHEYHECYECVNFENSNNYIFDFHQVNFSNNNINQFELKYFSTIEYSIEKIYLTRAPPIS